MRLIDADALEQAGYILTRTYQQDAKTMVYETKKLSDVPSVQAEREKGAWIVIDDAERKYQCDECKAMSYVLGNFCPNCGADMRGESDEKQHSQEVD